ncbi:MAG: hypothetical protein IPK86_03215 [Neisseriales bacterium]|nr:MAG: hypothetical protein IPK86_03215 [Neisseriales bacterium]
MNMQKQRLIELLQFCSQSTRLRGNPVANISAHNNFLLYEENLSGAIGIHFNISQQDDDEIWLSVDRLHETSPPEITNIWLRPWVSFTHGPQNEPTLLATVSGASLIKTGTHFPKQALEESESKGPFVDPDALINIENYNESMKVQKLFDEYVALQWVPWSLEEKKRLHTIKLYSELYTLKQQLDGEIVEAQPELVWGIGVGVWKTNATTVRYPIIGQLVELTLNQKTAAIEIRPRSNIEPRVELDWYVSQKNYGTTGLEKAAKEFFDELQVVISPFDHSTYEPLLRNAATNLDAHGIYWLDQTQPSDRAVPKADDRLKVTDTWILFARPRTHSAYLQDLDRMIKAVEEQEAFPPAVLAIITEPDTENPEIKLAEFRGFSTVYRDGMNLEHNSKDFYFPKPFNGEQVKIIQRLESHSGVVVQGPPGTGKTHTIANIICHFLANGKRILVTSMKDPALSVLHQQLPDEIKPLAIPLLTNDQDGQKQFEYSIQKISSAIQSVDRSTTAKEINHLEENIDALHSKLAKIDWDISVLAKKIFGKIAINEAEIDPYVATLELIENKGNYEWIEDTITISSQFDPLFNNEDIKALKDVRRKLGHDIAYVKSSLPQMIELPKAEEILQIHQDISRLEELKKEAEADGMPNLMDTTQKTFEAVRALSEDIKKLQKIRETLKAADYKWLLLVTQNIEDRSKRDFVKNLYELGEKFKRIPGVRERFIKKPVSVPDEMQPELLEAIKRLSEGKYPFGLSGLLGKSAEKKAIKDIRILGHDPRDEDEWKHVASYIKFQKDLKELTIRWNVIAPEVGLPRVAVSAKSAQQAYEFLLVFENIGKQVELKQKISLKAKKLFPLWLNSDLAIGNKDIVDELIVVLNHHLSKSRLANVWAQKSEFQKILTNKSGLIVEAIRAFLNQTLGDPLVTDSKIQETWLELTAELSRVLKLRPQLDVVVRVTELIKQSGAPEYAMRLQQPVSGAIDHLLPNNLQ